MNLKQLKYFVAVAEELHFGRAAERLGIAQPPLSRQIKQFENYLGVLLFNRGRSQISLTQAGDKLYEKAQQILSLTEDTKLEVRRIGQGAEGRLRIGFVGSSTYGMFPNLLKSFRRHYPKVDLSLLAMNNAGLRRALIKREIDIAIARPKLDDVEIISRKLKEEPLILAVPDTSRIASRKMISLTELEGETFVLYPEKPRPSFADLIVNICDKANVETKKCVFAMDFQTAISLVSIEAGVAIVPASVGEAERRGVRFVRIIEDFATTTISVNYRIDEQGIHIKNFVDLAMQAAQNTI